MRASAALALLCAPLALAGLFTNDQKPIAGTNSIAVPGANPLVHCHETDTDLLTIDRLDLDPNPPRAGVTLSINATGHLKEELQEGAYVMIQVKVGSIPLIKRREDICQQVRSTGQDCPLEEGEVNIVKDVEIPNEVPPAKFTVVANAYTVDERELTCLTGVVDFGAK